MTKRIALVVLSGGQDSTTCLAMAMADKALGIHHEVRAVTFDYGQRHRREIDAAFVIGKLAGVDGHEFIEVGPILAGTSPLTNRSEALEQYKDHDSMAAIIGSRIEKTFVPMRNALFLTLAANRAVVMGAQTIITGVCEADNANYPDCRESFLRKQEWAINEALGADRGDEGYITLMAPLMHLSKAKSIDQLVRLGMERFAWLAFSHTAYDGQYPPLGKDHATLLRAHGFDEADVPDPLIVRASMENLMPWPTAPNYIVSQKMDEALKAAIQRHKDTIESWDAAPAGVTEVDPTMQTR